MVKATRKSNITKDGKNGSCTRTSFLYDAILMDNQMKNMNGPEAAIEIRKLGYTGLIIGITGNVMEPDVSIYKNAGASYVLAKPTNSKYIHDLIVEANSYY